MQHILASLQYAVRGRDFTSIGSLLASLFPELALSESELIEIATRALSGALTLEQLMPASAQAFLFNSKLVAPSAFHVDDGRSCKYIGLEFDHLAKPIELSIFSVLNRMINWAVEPDKKLAVVASCRNEGPWILEWLAYYRAIGVEDIYLGFNDVDDSSDDLIKLLAQHGVVRAFENMTSPTVSPQIKFLNYCATMVDEIHRYKWALFVDLDEFVVPDKIVSYNLVRAIDKILEKAPNAQCICFPWTWLSGNYKYDWEDGFVIDRFRSGSYDSVVKCVARTDSIWSVHHPHSIETINSDAVVNASGDQVYISIDDGKVDAGASPLARINHYYGKSFQEFSLKKSRGRAALGLAAPQRDFSTFRWGQSGNVDSGIPESLRASMLYNYNILIKLPGVEELHAETIRIARKKVAVLEGEAELFNVFDQLRKTHV